MAPRRAFGIEAVVSAQSALDLLAAAHANGDVATVAAPTTPAAAPRKPRRSRLRPFGLGPSGVLCCVSPPSFVATGNNFRRDVTKQWCVYNGLRPVASIALELHLRRRWRLGR